eukprot:6184660-Pleurochrysis_carterae.AAC.3
MQMQDGTGISIWGYWDIVIYTEDDPINVNMVGATEKSNALQELMTAASTLKQFEARKFADENWRLVCAATCKHELASNSSRMTRLSVRMAI